ncbi:MAG: iron ABC transporter permease [Cyclobacteriaceae bacterium]|nr:iron ABC transporter permease [Cyclobacteriaceae bacterium]
MTKTFKKRPWLTLSALSLGLFVLNVSQGSVQISINDWLGLVGLRAEENPVLGDIIVNFRLTKALTCILAGGALSLGGLMMQTLFRNPLAGPDVLGLSSGASLAVALLVMLGSTIPGYSGGAFIISLGATAGSGAILLIILAIAHRIKDNTSLLLIGLMIGATTASIVSVLQFVSRTEDQHYFLIWTFGSMGGLNWKELIVLGGVLSIGIVLAVSVSKPLNAWLLGDQYARSLGIQISKSRFIIIVATSLLAGSVTAFCGPIAFVGLAVPHLTRILINTTNHRILIPGVLLMGASVMLFCDTIAQLPGSAHVLPINAITALIGAPVVIWVIVRAKKVVV